MNKKIKTLYFSPTGTTQKIVKSIAGKIAENNGGNIPVSHVDFTLPEARKEIFSFDKDDLVIAGVPVYAGRVPNVLLKFMNTISGNGATAVAVVLYGNRDYEDALLELKDILEANGFNVVAGGAFIGEHSFSTVLGANRPDQRDMAAASGFAVKIGDKIKAAGEPAALSVKGNKPYREYYRVKNPDGKNVSILKVTPRTNSDCIDCKLCSQVCPMGSIDSDDVSKVTGICIKCCACVKNCPVEAKYFDDENYLRHKQELELTYGGARREPECFV
jgi:NAD-dependent dihydropyrimidine dehydrogenase PreA subunit/flavodoxin